MSRLTFPSSLCLDEAGERQSVGELERSQGLLGERGEGKYSCFVDGAWDWAGAMGEGLTSFLSLMGLCDLE